MLLVEEMVPALEVLAPGVVADVQRDLGQLFSLFGA